MPGDNVTKVPTVDEEMARFKGFTVENGETADPAKENLNPVGKGVSAEEAKHGATVIEETPVELDTDDNGAAAGEKKGEQKTPPAKGKTVEDRIGELTKARRAAERSLAEERAARRAENERWEARFKSLEDRVASGALTRDGKAATEQDDPNAPKPSSYEYGELDSKYIRDLARYETKKELEAEKKARETQRTQAAASDVDTALIEKAKAFEDAGTAEYDDFEDVVIAGARAGEWPLTKEVGELILDSEQGHKVAYYLATNVKEARQVAKMKPLEQAKWFARKEDEFSAGATAAADGKSMASPEGGQETRQTKVVTKAPPPPPNRARGGQGSTTVSADTQDFAAFEAMHAGRATH